MTLAVDESLESLSLSELNARLVPDAQRVLHIIAKRMVAGQRKHGNLVIETDPRDWRSELREELLDAVVYDAIDEAVGGRRRMLDAVTAVQTRCNELLEENRALKRAQK